MKENEIYFYLKWTARYDNDHLKPLEHVLGDNCELIHDSNTPWDKYGVDFAKMPKKVWVETNYTQQTSNTIELSHGIDEDEVWCGEGHKAVNNVRYPLFLQTKHSEDVRGTNYYLIEKDDKFDPKKKTIMYLSSLNYGAGNQSVFANSHVSKEAPEYDGMQKLSAKLKKELNDLTNHFNVILKTHPNDADRPDYPSELPNVIVDPETHWMEIAEHIDLLIGESSGSTFAIFPIINDREIPVVWSCNNFNGRFDSIKHKVMNENHVVIHHGDQDLKAHVDEAFKEFENKDRKKERLQKRKEQLKYMFGGATFAHVNKYYAEYYTVVHIIKNLYFSPKEDKAYQEMIQAYKDLTLCNSI